MLLQRLVEVAARDSSRPFHRSRLFSWQLDLDAEGAPRLDTLIPLVDTDSKGRTRGIAHTVPAAVRTVGVAPALTADDVQYVLGWTDEDSNPARVAQCANAFTELTLRWAESEHGRNDQIAQAVASFYRSDAIHKIRYPEGSESEKNPGELAKGFAKQGVLITVDDIPAYEGTSVVPFWTAEVVRRKGGGVEGFCIVCGQVNPLLDTLPGKIPARLVPGASNDAALVSVNERVFGYDLTTQLGCSPICVACGEAINSGLLAVLQPPYTTTFSGQDSRMSWWLTHASEFTVMDVLKAPKPQDVSNLMRSPKRGEPNFDVDPELFCSLTVGGNVARIMVRDWIEMPVSKVLDNVIAWFDDHAMVSLRPGNSPYYGITRLAAATGRWLPGTTSYAEFGVKGADRPNDVFRQLMHTALLNRPLPTSLLAHLIHRVRRDNHFDDSRAALVRLALTRAPSTTEKPMLELDDHNDKASYLAGRVFAVLEALQYDSSGGKLNTTYGDRYLSSAVANPRIALVAGHRDATAWLKKLRRTRPGAAINHEKNLDQLFVKLGEVGGIPGRGSIDEQAWFLLGYHHQRANRFAAIAANKPDPSAGPSPEEPTK
ncbi:type I-C CRISPR-associated protein Cas8c/Csd1 [Nocardia sp. CDC160]|uniref:type I-C CRISPR-associated protein Cas8c/Csd1 n=1 Tax=Nocardia sp. CDC160 TaxID=3112166 RepID=UPI002DBF0BD3|nr:type I-C CRISPR-associated protein Cas8c/Csd1 [Nocardia sp. CDC160]MEC3915974.1 type I-C CRISPR-associated protein Cas8c/Csd1 [Nocardia sp. CDC160]